MDERIVEYLDHGTEGAGPGDVRIGYMPLVDDTGTAVGHHRWNLLTLDPDLTESGNRTPQRITTQVLVFDDGEIFTIAIPTAVGTPDDTSQPSVQSYEGAVIGGTGTYAFARGTVTRTFGDGTATFELNIRCD